MQEILKEKEGVLNDLQFMMSFSPSKTPEELEAKRKHDVFRKKHLESFGTSTTLSKFRLAILVLDNNVAEISDASPYEAAKDAYSKLSQIISDRLIAINAAEAAAAKKEAERMQKEFEEQQARDNEKFQREMRERQEAAEKAQRKANQALEENQKKAKRNLEIFKELLELTGKPQTPEVQKRIKELNQERDNLFPKKEE